MALLKPRQLQYPFTLEQISGLRVGQWVNVSGRVFTARDRIHEYLARGGKAPVDLKDGAIFHCGPVMVRHEDGWLVRAAGPTTTTRSEPYLPAILRDYGVRVIIGKGTLGRQAEAACARWGCVYLHAVGGAGQSLAAHIEKVSGGYFVREFGLTEALWELTVRDLPAVVAIDVRGRSLTRRVHLASRRALARLLADTEPFAA